MRLGLVGAGWWAREVHAPAFQGASARIQEEKGIRVSVVAPGGAHTEFAFGTGRTPEDPRLKAFLRPEEVAEAVVFALAQPPHARVFLVGMRPMVEPL